MNAHPQTQSSKDLLTDLSADLKDLYKRENITIKSELRSRIHEAEKGVSSFAGGGVLLLLGGLSGIGSVVAILEQWMPLWAASLIVTGSLIGGGLALVLIGKRLLTIENLAPRSTIQLALDVVHSLKLRRQFHH